MIELLKAVFPEYMSMIKIALSLLLSSLIGLERESSDKPMGLRGIMLVTLGTTVFAVIALTMQSNPNHDMTRLLYAPIVGIGFLGSGVIIEHKGHASGITTATVLWAVVGISLLIGLGMFELGIISTLLVYGILKLKVLEKRMIQ